MNRHHCRLRSVSRATVASHRSFSIVSRRTSSNVSNRSSSTSASVNVAATSTRCCRRKRTQCLSGQRPKHQQQHHLHRRLRSLRPPWHPMRLNCKMWLRRMVPSTTNRPSPSRGIPTSSVGTSRPRASSCARMPISMPSISSSLHRLLPERSIVKRPSA